MLMNVLKELQIVLIVLHVGIQLDHTNVIVLQDIEEMEMFVKVCLMSVLEILVVLS